MGPTTALPATGLGPQPVLLLPPPLTPCPLPSTATSAHLSGFSSGVTYALIPEGSEIVRIKPFSDQRCCTCPFTVLTQQRVQGIHHVGALSFHHVTADLPPLALQGQASLTRWWLLSVGTRHKESKVPRWQQ